MGNGEAVSTGEIIDYPVDVTAEVIETAQIVPEDPVGDLLDSEGSDGDPAAVRSLPDDEVIELTWGDPEDEPDR